MPLRSEQVGGADGPVSPERQGLTSAALTSRLYGKPKAPSAVGFRLSKPPKKSNGKAGSGSGAPNRLSPIKSFTPLVKGSNARFSGGETAVPERITRITPPSTPAVGTDPKPLDQIKPALLPKIAPGRVKMAPEPDKHGVLEVLNMLQVRNNTTMPTSGDMADVVDMARGMSQLELVELVRALPGEAFFYMMPVAESTSVEDHAYNLKVVGHEEINPTNFHTMSKNGVEHVWDKTSEFTPLDRWVKEIHSFTRIRQMKTFRMFRIWKQYAVWRNVVVKTKRARMAGNLEEGLFLVDKCLQPALLNIRRLCIDVVELQLCQIDDTKTYTLSEFMEAQHTQIDLVKGRLGNFRSEVSALVMKACCQLLTEEGFPTNDAGQDLVPESDEDGEASMTYTQQAIKRAVCNRLRNFVRLVDLLVAGAMQALAVESVSLLKRHVGTLEQSSDPEPKDFTRWELADAAAAAEPKFEDSQEFKMLGPEEKEIALYKRKQAQEYIAISKLPYFVTIADGRKYMPRQPEKKKAAGNTFAARKAKESKEDITPAKPALISVTVSMDTEQLIFEPQVHAVVDELMELVELFQTSVIGLECLLLDPVMQPFTRPVIAGRVADVELGEGVNLRAVFDDDDDLKSLQQDISSTITRSFEASLKYSETLERFREMYKGNEGLDVKWVEETEHAPAFFEQSLNKYKRMYSLGSAITKKVIVAVFELDCEPFKAILLPSPQRCLEIVENVLPKLAAKQNQALVRAVDNVSTGLDVQPESTEEFVANLEFLSGVTANVQKLELDTKRVSEFYKLIDKYEISDRCEPEDQAEHSTLRQAMMRIVDIAKEQVDEMPNKVNKFVDVLDKDISTLGADVLDVRNRSQDRIVFDADADPVKALEFTSGLFDEMETLQAKSATYKKYQRQFKIDVTKFSSLEETHAEVRGKNNLWKNFMEWEDKMKSWDQMAFTDIDAEALGNEVNGFFKQVYSLSKLLPPNDVVPALQMKIEKMKAKVPVISDLRNPFLMPRHWTKLNEVLDALIEPIYEKDADGNQVLVGLMLPREPDAENGATSTPFTLSSLEELEAFSKVEELQEIGGGASSEAALDNMMTKLEESWNGNGKPPKIVDEKGQTVDNPEAMLPVEFECIEYRGSKDVYILGGKLEEIQVLLDDSQVNISTISGSRYCEPIKDRVENMTMALSLFSKTLEQWMDCQRSWQYLESIFSAPDIIRQLPEEAKMFQQVDKSFKEAMRKTNSFPNALRAGCTPGFLDMFTENNALLDTINKCLEDYLEGKRAVFSRFYFLSNDELLEILSQTRNFLAVQPHVRKCFDAIKSLEFGDGGVDEEGEKKYTNDILAMNCPWGEQVQYGKGLKARGNVEVWLGDVEKAMVKALTMGAKASIVDYAAKERTEWAQGHPSQIVLMVSQIYWTKDVSACLASENPIASLGEYETKLKGQLAMSATLARGKLAKLVRKVLSAMITIDVHARDIITNMIKVKCDDAKQFEWTKQLRYLWDEDLDTCVVKMSNAVCYYSYEYLGADMRLVVTPLTDRCYLCLLGAVQLDLGGAPAGPAGTGKTETTKDLAKAIGIQCVVFNCSEQMDFRMTGRFFAGLAQSGAWCCFDEFNRIDIEVLSVIAQQILTIRNAKVARQNRFFFEGREIGLIRTCAAFITMNPGYAGRTELPDNLKALFRPMSMMVPDYGLIAEVILFSEGFEDPTALARKMVQMYKLCSEQLSQQDHYDFGMRAVKSVLVMAGSLKRSRLGQSEAQVLLTALRDSNLPKFLTDDAILFKAILSDLFPGIELEDHDYGSLQTAIEFCCAEKGLTANEPQVHKIIQFYETMVVRHGVMLVGPTGGGKTTCYEVLKEALTKLSIDEADDPNKKEDYKPVHTHVMNPKSVSMGELYGEVSLASGEWTDGLMATRVRECVNAGNENEDHQWIMCDGPVDALWIENMNTVLDDNKMLCLANSERIKLTPYMHMCFEVQDLAVASPATVSRCGMVYVDPSDMNWQPYFDRWLKNLGRLDEGCKEFLDGLFKTHVSDILYFVRKTYTVAMEQVDLGKVATMCTLLEQLIGVESSGLDATVTEENEDDIQAGIAMSFVFALTWGIGGNLNQQFHEPFDTYLRDLFSEVRGVRIPGLGLLFDFRLNYENHPPTFEKWEEVVPKFTYDSKMEFFDMLVPTVATVKHSFLLETFTAANMSTLFTGLTGVGKSVIAVDCLAQMEKKGVVVPVTLNFSAQTSALRTQEIIESKLEKKGKSRLGAPANKKVVIFVDDLNMPKLDTYGSQPPIELLRQYQDFKGFYDREKLFWKDVKDVVLVAACAPPGGGRNPVTPRFIRHFAMFSLPKPDDLALKTIFTQILQGFLIAEEFSKPIQNLAKNIIDASSEIYGRMAVELLPTPDKSHYLFNLRDLSKVVQGILQADQQVVREPDLMIDLFFHESLRVFHDRLTTKDDKFYYCGMLSEMAQKHFRKTISAEDFIEKPLIFGDYMKVGASEEDRQYEKLENDKIAPVLNEYLDTYNMESTKEMNLVFFNDAIEHVSRISRMIRQPRGNALLVGVGGTGKQSLTRMACVMGGFKCIQIEITRGYGHTEFREDLKQLYLHAGTKGEEVVFLFTDTQIVVESFLEDINNILNSGEVPNLFEPEEVERFIGPVRPLAKAAGLPETRDAVFGFFINRVRQHLHLVLCMSPVGSAFRSRCRMFPSLVNCCTIDWFTEWPEEALQSVSTRFFEFVDLGSDEMKSKISEMCVVIHTSVATVADRFYDELRRRYYTTPTSYLELINLYTAMLGKKRQDLMLQRDRYASGMKKLNETDTLIGTMEVELTALAPILKEKSEATAALMINVKKEEADTQKVQEVVAKEEAMAMKDAEETEAIKADAQKDLDMALPALAGAQKALASLEKKDIQEIKAFATPPELVQFTLEAVCTLFPKKTGNKVDWKTAKGLLGESDLMKWLVDYDKDNVTDKTLKKLKKYIDDERFQPDTVAKTSSACKSLCLWVRAIDLYSHVFRTVQPKREKLEAAEASLKKTMDALKKKQATLKEYTDKIAVLQKQFKESVDAKESLERQAQLTKDRLKRAGQLQSSLGSEKVRWAESVEMFDKQLVDVIGNVFLASACVAYFGAFTSSYRAELVAAWSAKCDELEIPRSEGMGLADVLSDPYQIRGWNANALPNDTLSIENAVLVTQGRRWPLMIDPQDQANTWIRTMERRNGLKVIKLTDGDFLRTLENCIRTGTPCLLEEVQDVLDPSLEPILLKQTFTQGGRLLIRLGDSDVDYDKNFRFYMTTKLGNPHYLPEICIKVTIINFTVTKVGLEDQLLGDVVRLERPDLEEKRTKLIMAINEDKAQLKSIEDKILKLLFNSEGNILDDEVLISTLGESKITSTAIGERLVEAEVTEKGITEARNKYKPVAIRGAIIFFVIADIGLIDEMYQYSLGYFKNLFVLCINQSEKSDDLDKRLATIMDYSTSNIFTNISRGLFEKHKLVFSFMLCAEIMRGRGDINAKTWNYYLRGAGAGDKTRPEKPTLDWLKELTWNNCYDLEVGLADVYEGLTADLVARPFSITIGSLTVFINNEEPWAGCADECAIDWNEKLDDFEKLLLIKTVATHMVIDATIQFVSCNIGPTFVESVPIELEVVYKDLSPTVPLIFVLSTGSDPMTGFMRFAKGLDFSDRYDAISLGQGQGPVAERMIAKACKEGRWVFLQNCHLAKSWMNGMEVVIKGLALPDAQVHADFRLYLSSMPCNFFPIGVLQNSVKVTNEPPKGLRANVRASFAGVDPDGFASNPLGVTYRKLIFGLCFFHANIQERKKFGPLGWNISYGFSTTDLETTLANLAIFLEEQGRVPWDALTYLIGEVYYGGRVTDHWDERTLRVILSRFFIEKSLEPGFTYSESGIYYPAEFDTVAEYVTYIESFPFSDAPDIFGLHENANMAFLSSETSKLIGSVLSVQPRLTTSGAEKTPDEIVFEVADMIQEKLRKTLIDIDEAKEHTFDRDAKGQVKSLSTVLRQEVDRFNILLVVLWDSIKNLKKAIKGLVVMSEELEQIYNGFINNQVPKMWSSSSYPSLQPLGAWVSDLVSRLEFIQSWLVDGQPASFWMSGFYYTQGFLTGTLQEHAREHGIPIDTLTFKFEVQAGIYIDPGQTVEEAGVTLPKIEDGVLTHGIFMEAFRWDDETKMLADSHEGEMVSYCPVVHMLPVPNFVIPPEDYNSPMYKTNFRQGMLSTTGHSTNFVVPIHFPTDKPPNYWVNKGAALLCQKVL